MENVFKDQKYNEWLKRSTSVGNANDKLTISKMQEANQILSERLNLARVTSNSLEFGLQR